LEQPPAITPAEPQDRSPQSEDQPAEEPDINQLARDVYKVLRDRLRADRRK
jgi:hypothetical protein